MNIILKCDSLVLELILKLEFQLLTMNLACQSDSIDTTIDFFDYSKKSPLL